ncbi:MAG: hypothetical protein G01um101425_747 [Candidatus Peregrinibacteria bacterium Gr01-1014_25]|nr:MAG: hypothetical protein G01um101425_747 [Candidatus Peregrinibacteria bacterium Gr01-1014_25]
MEVQRTGLQFMTPEFEGETDSTLRVTLFPATIDEVRSRVGMETYYIDQIIAQNAQSLQRFILDARHVPQMSSTHWKQFIGTISKARRALRKDTLDTTHQVSCENLPAHIIEVARLTLIHKIADLHELGADFTPQSAP